MKVKFGQLLDTNNMAQNEEDFDVIEKKKVKLPKRYKVFLHNDDYTTMEFVVMILQSIFHMSLAEAEKVMLEVHKAGIGLCGVYTHEIAETKSNEVIKYAKDHGYPLKCTISPE